MDDSTTPVQNNDDNLDTNSAAAGGPESPELLQDLTHVGINPGEKADSYPETLDEALSEGEDLSRINPTQSANQDQDYSVEPLSQDVDSPASPASSAQPDADQDISRQKESNQLNDTHPITDSATDATELYDEGLSGAAEAQEPNAGNTVVDYDPEA